MRASGFRQNLPPRCLGSSRPRRTFSGGPAGNVLIALTTALLLVPNHLPAEVRSSTSFSVEADTLDGGGGLSTSATYSNEGSFEPAVTGESSSASDTILHGFINGLTVITLGAYDSWAQIRGLTSGLNAGFFDDPNSDGRPNLNHFAFDTDPLGSKADENKRVLGTVNIGGLDYLTLTLPIRKGAIFAGSPGLTSNAVDDIIYDILGDSELDDPWVLEVIELVPALDAGLPSLGDYDAPTGGDWHYRTFRLTVPVSASMHSFMKAGATPSP